MTKEDLIEINRLFSECGHFRYFFDKNERKIKIGDFVRVNLTSNYNPNYNSYAESQVLCLVNHSFIKGISFEVVGLYNEKEVEVLPKYVTAKSEYNVNQWPLSTTFTNFDYSANENGIRIVGEHGIWPEKSNVKIVKFCEEIDKVELCYNASRIIATSFLQTTGEPAEFDLRNYDDCCSFIKNNIGNCNIEDIVLRYM